MTMLRKRTGSKSNSPLKILNLFIVLSMTTMISARNENDKNYGNVSTFSDSNHINMIVEIPAGTNKKIEYEYTSNTFKIDTVNGEKRVINFLPYPANYGFIPSTIMDVSKGGDGDALDILLISESIETGTIIQVIPIAVIILNDSDENDSKIIAIPVDKNLRIINADSYKKLNSNYPIIKDLIRLWFLNYKDSDVVEFIEWGNEIEAMNKIKSWSLKNNE
jgi:inorganic pyrophosphatase